jgi:mRNA-degrading endonuclease RelE of RelBE toxin-antitoxin system
VSSWQLVLAGPAERQLAKLPSRVAAAVVEFMVGPLLEDPHRVGKPLQRELTGYHSARRGAYRIVYRIERDRQRVRVVRVEHRSLAYRLR